MKTGLLLFATLAVGGATVKASGQSVRPESLSYMSRLFRLNDFSLPENPRYSRDGKWLAFDARPSGGGSTHIFVVPAGGGTPTAITSGTHNQLRPMWTAAGDRLVYYSAEGTGAVMTVGIDPATGRPIGAPKRVTIDSLRPHSFDVAPDGRSVAYLTPTGADKLDLRLVPITGGPAKTVATIDAGTGSSGYMRFDRDGKQIYFLAERLGANTAKIHPARDVKRIAITGGEPATVFAIPETWMGVQIDPIADRIIIRDGDRAHLFTLAAESIGTIAWAQGIRSAAHLAFTPDGSALVTGIDATQTSIHVVPLDGGPPRALTDGNSYPWPDMWIGGHIFVSDNDHGVQTLIAPDGTKQTISFDLRKANGGVPMKVVNDDPFPDGIHYIVKGLDAAGDTSLFVYDARTGDARRVMDKVTGSRAVWFAGVGDDYSSAMGDEMVFRHVRNGVVEFHAVDVSGRDRVVRSLPMPKAREGLAFAPGRLAHSYERSDTAFLDVTFGSGPTVHAFAQPGLRMGEVVFNRDGTSLYADVIAGKAPNTRSRGIFFSTVDAHSLARPARWVETIDCWHPTWLPNGSGVLEFCESDSGNRTWVSRIPANGAATPQPLTQRETAVFWDYTMSPDGKYVAVPAEKNAGANLWRIDLRAAAKVALQGKGNK